MSTSTETPIRALVTLTVPAGTDPHDLATAIDWHLSSFGYGDLPVDSTVYLSEDDYLHDLEEMVCREGPCFRCGTEVTEQIERVALDQAGRADCAEADEPGMPHEIDPPDGWFE